MVEPNNPLRRTVIEALGMFAPPGDQRVYQRNVPFVSVPVEMLCGWADIFAPQAAVFRDAFDDDELLVLQEFNGVFIRISGTLPDPLPPLEEFITSDQGAALATAARVALAKLAAISLGD